VYGRFQPSFTEENIRYYCFS